MRLFGRSAGTHSALAFAAHLDELNAEWDGLLGPQPRTPWQTDRHEAPPSSPDENENPKPMLIDLVSDENSDFCAYEDSSSPPGSSSPRSSASMEV